VIRKKVVLEENTQKEKERQRMYKTNPSFR